MEPLIRNVADTALWVAFYRADETERSDALFHDPFARRLAGERGYKIVEAMGDGRKNSWSFIARTLLFDEFIMEHVHEGYEMILNLASGLDTRPYRLPLNESISWIDVDLPEMTAYMDKMMAGEKENCMLERVGIDLSDRKARLELFNKLGSQGKKTLVVAEGLVGYLNESANGSLAYDLSHQKQFRHWVLDLMSPGILPLIKEEMGSLLDNANAPLIFAPEEGEDFFQLFKWKPVESRSKLKKAASLKRIPSDLMEFASLPEPAGPKGAFPWSGVCLFENVG